MKKLLLVIIALALYGVLEKNPHILDLGAQRSHSDHQLLEDAYQNRQSNLQVGGTGVVIQTLADDRVGSQHQKFIVKLASGRTLLIAHNIDLAPKIHSLQKGDTVEFYGEYQWNSKGGLLHWTHHDPAGRHPGGWLKHKGTTYQ